MKLYSKKGDEGFTSLLSSKRVRKDDPRLEAIGVVDELNTCIGWAICESQRITHIVISGILQKTQEELFTVAARLGSLGTNKPPRDLPAHAIDRMEADIDTICEELQTLKAFILPGGSELACRLHICRAVCRRAERTVIHLLNPVSEEILHDPESVRYLNRLGDLLFALARLANRDADATESVWSASSES